MDRLVASSDFPFGIHSAARIVDASPCRLLVYPKTFDIHHLPGFEARTRCHHGEQVINRPHSDEEYAGVREYRHSDSLKHIHWGASAKHQELIVREFESYSQPAILIILNCNADDDVGSAPDSCFEYAIEIAASLMLFAARRRIAVELVAEGECAFQLGLAPGENVSDYHLGQFAQMKADGSRDYREQIALTCGRFHHIDTVVTFSPRADFAVPLLNDRNHIDIRFECQSFANRNMPGAISPSVQTGSRFTYTVKWGDDLENLFDESR